MKSDMLSEHYAFLTFLKILLRGQWPHLYVLVQKKIPNIHADFIDVFFYLKHFEPKMAVVQESAREKISKHLYLK